MMSWIHSIDRSYHAPRIIKGACSEVNTGDPILYLKHHMDGSIEPRYHVNIIDQLSDVFLYDGMRFLSRDQERFISKFIEQAGKVTDKLNEEAEDPFNDMDEVFVYLDKFLGNYRGIDNGPYTR